VATDLQGRRLVVGDAGDDIGRSIAAAAVAAGARVLLVCRDGEAGTALARELGDDAFALEADLATEDGVDTVVMSVAITLGAADGVVLVGDAAPQGAALDLEDEVWLACLRPLVVLPIRLLRGLAPQLTPGSSAVLVVPDGAPTTGAAAVVHGVLTSVAAVLTAELEPSVRVQVLAAVEALDALR
jgi:NAD(P)-dependent dehydrogenase (short-subunit alcohol dehydrogenase family)